MVKKLRADKEAKRLDLVDLVEFILGTAVRIGEACALRVPQVDVEGGTIEVSATVTDFGIEERPKTKAGWRVIAVPPNVVKILGRRMRTSNLRTDVALSPIGRVRDSSKNGHWSQPRRAGTSAFVLGKCAVRESNPQPADSNY